LPTYLEETIGICQTVLRARDDKIAFSDFQPERQHDCYDVDH